MGHRHGAANFEGREPSSIGSTRLRAHLRGCRGCVDVYLFAFYFLTVVGVTFVRLEITSDLRGGYDNKIGWNLLFMVF